ncbi:MAG: ribonuclease P protein component [Bacilli bacterium]|nr:ribonuclease P protein component [Bacilli bacterium]
MKREYRILKRPEFDEIIRNHPFVRSKNYVIHYRDGITNHARIGIAVGKKNGCAVTRNCIKRQIRSMINEELDLNKSIDLVIIVRASFDVSRFHSNKDELHSSLTKIGDHN